MNILIKVTNSGTQFIGSADLVEECGNNRILGDWAQILQGDDTVIQCFIGVVGEHLTFFNDETCRSWTGIFTVNKYVSDHFAENFFSQIDPNIILKKEFLRQMLYAKVDKHLIAFNQVGHHSNPVIVAINIHLAHNCIGLICRKNILNYKVFAKQQNRSSIESIGIVYIIPTD